MLFCLFTCLATVWVLFLSSYPSWHAPSGPSSSLLPLGGMSSQQDISPKRAWAGTLEYVFPSPHRQTMPSYLWPMTSPPPVLAGYRLVMFGPYTCFTSMYIRNLSAAHTFAVAWRLVCTSCRPSLASYGMSHFLAFHSLAPAPFGGWAFAWLWAFLPSAYFFTFSVALLSFPAIPLYHSYCKVVCLNFVGPLWTCRLFFS